MMASEAMKKEQIFSLITRMYSENITSLDYASFSEEKLDAIFKELKLTFTQLMRRLTFDFIDVAGVTTITPDWKYMCLNFYCLQLLNAEMKKEELLSVSQIKELQRAISIMVHIGILQNLTPSLPYFKPYRLHEAELETRYYMLKGSVCGLYKYALLPTLRIHILPIALQGILLALFQLAYCPIKKPPSGKPRDFDISDEFYNELSGDQDRFQGFLETIQNSVNPQIFLKELMILFRADTPIWFKKAISANLSAYVKQKNGLENIVKTMLGGAYDNDATMWRVIEVITQIVVKTLNSEDFVENMVPQINNLLHTGSDENFIAFEKLYASILNAIDTKGRDQTDMLLQNLFIPLRELSKNNNVYKNNQIFANAISQRIRVIHYTFLDTKDFSLPLNLLKPYIYILFRIFIFVKNTRLTSIKSDLLDIIAKYIKTSEKSEVFQLFENFLFNDFVPKILSFRNELIMSESSDSLVIEISDAALKPDIIEVAHSMYAICKSDHKLFFLFFEFLLNCICQPQKYFPDTSLLEDEDEGNLSNFGKKFAVFEMLSILADDAKTNKHFIDGIPDEVIEYFNLVLATAIRTGDLKNRTDSTSFELVFTIAIILDRVVSCGMYDMQKSPILDSVKTVWEDTNDEELKKLLKKILDGPQNIPLLGDEMDEVDRAIQEAYDEMIPVKGHGLIALERLIFFKHPRAIARKHYIFTVLKENLSNRDTYIYQSAIKGLASISDLEVDDRKRVLETLCEEYTDFQKDDFDPDANDMRLKIGEILVHISKNLGEMAPSHKAALLNAFLSGTKDDDHLIRASALSNLGEICKVLGYKLGSMATEILICVHAVISTDKKCEPRRAAVLVIRELFSGLGSEMLTVLKDDILACYRTLKFLYENDKDEILKLHAQIALEVLNHNMKGIIFPQLELNFEKKPVVLQ